MNLKERARSLKIYLPALYLALGRRDTPLLAKLVAGLAVGYALSPIDLIPDFIPVLGLLDDLILLPLLVGLAIRMIPGQVLAECKLEAEGLWQDGKPKKWYLAVPIALLWLALLAALTVAVVR
jgi:uncharacterized membrane protein YkvA (DUF1232 family)